MYLMLIKLFQKLKKQTINFCPVTNIWLCGIISGTEPRCIGGQSKFIKK